MKTILRLLVLASIVFSVYSCIREDVDNCLQYSLKVKAVDIEGNDITATGSVTSVDIYMFDENGFVRMIPQGSADYLVGTDKQKQVTLVAWGNLKSDSLKIPDLKVGTSLSDARVELIQQEDGYHLPTTDIFYSRQEVNGASTRGILEETLTLTLERRVAAMTIRTKNLEQKFGAGEPCYFVVYGVGNALNFMGEPTGGTVGYQPKVSYTANKDGYTSAFRILPTPTENALSIRVCRGSTILYTVSEDYLGNPLVAVPGEQLNIVIDFMASGGDPNDPNNPDNPDNPGGNPNDPNNPDNPDNPGGDPNDPNNPDNPDNPGGDPNDPNNPDNPDNPGGDPSDPVDPDTPKGTIKVTVNVVDWGTVDQDTKV